MTHCETLLQHNARPADVRFASCLCHACQWAVTHYNTRRHTATHFNALQHTATHCTNKQRHTATHIPERAHTATYCNNILQHRYPSSDPTHMSMQDTTVTTCCNTLQHTATRCNNTLQQHITTQLHTAIHNTIAHCNTATNCNTHTRARTHCNILQQHTATQIRELGPDPNFSVKTPLQQNAVTYCSILRYTEATHYNTVTRARTRPTRACRHHCNNATHCNTL